MSLWREARVGEDLAQRAFELAHVGAHVLGDEEGDVLGHRRRLLVGLLHQDRDPHLELGRLDRDGQPGVEARGQALVDVDQSLRIGVAGHDDVRALGEQRLEGVEELLLRALLAGEELDVVDQQQVERVVLRLQLVEGLALVVLHHVGDELLGVQVEDARIGPVGEQRVADGVDQVRLAEADAAVDEERVVHEAGRAGDVQRGGARHLVGAAGNQRVEGQRRIEPAARGQRGRGGVRRRRWRPRRRRCRCRGAARGRSRRRRSRAPRMRRVEVRPGGRCRRRAVARARAAVALRERDVEPHRLAGELGQHGLDAAGVLVADPVELEAIRHAHGDDRAFAVVGDVGVGQRPDPGVELLFGQLGRQAFAAALPEVGSHVWRSGPRKRRIVRRGRRRERQLSTGENTVARERVAGVAGDAPCRLTGRPLLAVIAGFPNGRHIPPSGLAPFDARGLQEAIMKRTYQASKVRRARTHGFLVRMKIARRPRRHQRPARQGAQAPRGLSARRTASACPGGSAGPLRCPAWSSRPTSSASSALRSRAAHGAFRRAPPRGAAVAPAGGPEAAVGAEVINNREPREPVACG